MVQAFCGELTAPAVSWVLEFMPGPGSSSTLGSCSGAKDVPPYFLGGSAAFLAVKMSYLPYPRPWLLLGWPLAKSACSGL